MRLSAVDLEAEPVRGFDAWYCRRRLCQGSGSAHKAAAAEVYLFQIPGSNSRVCDRYALELCWNRSNAFKYNICWTTHKCKYGTHLWSTARCFQVAALEQCSMVAGGRWQLAEGQRAEATNATIFCSSCAPHKSATEALRQRPLTIWCQICHHRVWCCVDMPRRALTWEVCASRVAAPRGGRGLVQAPCGQRSALSLRFCDLRPSSHTTESGTMRALPCPRAAASCLAVAALALACCPCGAGTAHSLEQQLLAEAREPNTAGWMTEKRR